MEVSNVVYTNIETLPPLLIQFKSEQTIYKYNSNNENLIQIQYENNVSIQINQFIINTDPSLPIVSDTHKQHGVLP
jgi:hypothetical protein